MLSKDKFIKGVRYLTTVYINFKIDLEDEFTIQVWYEFFQDLDDDTFTGLLKTYAKQNQYAPQSPASILQLYKEVKQSQLMSAEQAWEIVESNLHKSIRGYQTMVNGNIVSRNDFYQAIKEYTQITAVCKEIESSLADITTESKKYVRNEFMTIYKRYSEQAVSIGYDERLKLT